MEKLPPSTRRNTISISLNNAKDFVPVATSMMTWGQNASVLKVQQGVRFTSFSMTTQNGLFGPHAALTDYYANAVGLDYLLHAKKGNGALMLRYIAVL